MHTGIKLKTTISSTLRDIEQEEHHNESLRFQNIDMNTIYMSTHVLDRTLIRINYFKMCFLPCLKICNKLYVYIYLNADKGIN